MPSPSRRRTCRRGGHGERRWRRCRYPPENLDEIRKPGTITLQFFLILILVCHVKVSGFDGGISFLGDKPKPRDIQDGWWPDAHAHSIFHRKKKLKGTINL